MYFKFSLRTNPLTNSLDSYYRLVESYRDVNGRVSHRTILNIGFLDQDITPEQLNQVSRRLTDMYQKKASLFDLTDPVVNRMVTMLWGRIVSDNRLDLTLYDKNSRMIDADTMVHKNIREVGAEWMCYNAWQELQIDKLLQDNGFTEQEIKLAQTQIISRAVNPASELATARWISENSAICELTGFPIENINKDRLYRGALKLYDIKEQLEQYLSVKTNELFDIQDKIILYDLTNTYFEGQKPNSALAKFGRSKEKRSDAKLVVLALVVNTFGFIKYSSIHEGNFSDSADLGKLIDHLAYIKGDQQPVVVIDAGIASESNLATIRQKGYHYLCVSRKQLKDYKIDTSRLSVMLQTKGKQHIVLKKVDQASQEDFYLEVTSEKKKIKEQEMKNQFEQRFELELEKIKTSLSRKGGTKTIDKVHERIGRAKQKYPSVHENYAIVASHDTTGKYVVNLSWDKNQEKEQAKIEDLGKYFLRTSMDIKEEIIVWDIYNTIREIENAFRTLKTDLDLRPIYHKKDASTLAHLNLGLLAYWLVNTIRQKLKAQGINHSWKEIIRIGNTQKVITTSGTNMADHIVEVRKCSEPNANLKVLIQALNIKSRPFTKLKSVVHRPKPKNPPIQYLRRIPPG